MSFNAYGSIFALFGNYIIFIALQKLSEYKHILTRCIPFLLLMAICNITNSVELLFSAEFGLFGTIIDTVFLVASFLFNIFLFAAIISFSEDTDLPEIKRTAKINIIVVCVYFFADLLMMILQGNKYIWVTVVFLRLIAPLLALVLIYKCFRFICTPDDVDMPQKPSRFKIINDFREKRAKKEEETKQAREELLKKSQSKAVTSSKHKKK